MYSVFFVNRCERPVSSVPLKSGVPVGEPTLTSMKVGPFAAVTRRVTFPAAAFFAAAD